MKAFVFLDPLLHTNTPSILSVFLIASHLLSSNTKSLVFPQRLDQQKVHVGICMCVRRMKKSASTMIVFLNFLPNSPWPWPNKLALSFSKISLHTRKKPEFSDASIRNTVFKNITKVTKCSLLNMYTQSATLFAFSRCHSSHTTLHPSPLYHFPASSSPPLSSLLCTSVL